ncbi:MAG: ABC transporter ATP-binding protein, partial [Deltaproteobacteria bacterium]
MRWSASRTGSASSAPMPAAVPMLRLANVEVVYDDVILVLKGLS